MNKLLRWSLAAFVAASASRAVALDPHLQITQYHHESWRIEDGLPDSVVRGIAQTDDGYLWIATYGGLARYNGEGFTRFDTRTLAALKRDTILAFIKTNDGALWAGTNGGGVTRILGGKGNLISTDNGLPSDTVNALAGDGADGVWIGGLTGGVIHYRGGKFSEHLTTAQGISSNSIFSLFRSPDGTLWIGTNGGGLNRLSAGRLTSYTTRDGLGNDVIYSLLGDSGTLWIGTGRGLNRLTRDGVMDHITGVPDDEITSLWRDSDGVLWIGTYSHGLYRDVDGVVASYSVRDGLLNNSVRSIFEDAERTLWVGTNGGLEKFSGAKFATIGPPEGLSDRYVRCVLEDRDHAIWIGTANGLNRIAGGETRVFTTKDGLPNDHILSLAQTRDGAIWAGTPTGLSLLKNGRFTTPPSSDQLTNPSVRAILQDARGLIWIGTDRGLNTFDGTSFRAASPNADWADAVAQPIVEGRDGTIWIGSDGQGLASYHDGRFQTWSSANGLPDDHIMSLSADPNGDVWIGTDGHGLVRMRNGQFHSISSAEGLYENKVVQIVDDGMGRLWFGGGRGVWFVSKRELNDFADGKRNDVHSVPSGRGDGLRSLQTNGFSSPAGLRGSDGRLWFPTVDGIATIDPRHPAGVNRRPPPVRIESILADGRERLSSAEALIPSGARELQIRYAALTFVKPEKVAFRYRLEGYDDEWVEAGPRHVAYYTGLPPRHYRFQVIAANADGVWNEQGATLSISIQPAWYQTLAFRILVIVGILSLILLIHRWRLRAVGKRQQVLEELVQERTADLARANEEVLRLSSLDGLTGLANRRRFDTRLAEEWSRAIRTGNELSLLMIDIDHFKQLNDVAGHQAGDQSLREVAQCVDREFNRAQDLAARYGGEEFSVILPATSVAETTANAERVRAAVEGLRLPHPSSPLGEFVTVSVGAATITPRRDVTPHDLIAAADKALYRAKLEGRNRAVTADVG